MMPDREKLMQALECIHNGGKGDCERRECQYGFCGFAPCNLAEIAGDALDLLKEQEAKERKWLQAIADNQLANAPKDSPMSLDEQLECEYKSGIYDGLQMAFEILMEGR